MEHVDIGIIGAAGAVGRAAYQELYRQGLRNIRIGGRTISNGEQLSAVSLGGPAEVMTVDVYDESSLRRFCDGCRVVLNCAGPSFRILDRVARAAIEAGADYVDPGGDRPLYERLNTDVIRMRHRVSVLTAGMMPGLSGLLPRWLVRQGFDRAERLTLYVGGLGRLSVASAADYVLSIEAARDEALNAWIGGAPAVRVLEPLVGLDLPFFRPGVTAHPFLSAEAERVARDLRLNDLSWYAVFDGQHLLQALARAQSQRLTESAAELMKGAALDLFGQEPYQVMLLEMSGVCGDTPVERTLVLRARSAQELTGTVAALATVAVIEGRIAPGIHMAAECLDPATIDMLRSSDTIASLEMFENLSVIESGAL